MFCQNQLLTLQTLFYSSLLYNVYSKKNLKGFSIRNVLETSISCTVHQQVYKSQLSGKNNLLPTLFLQLYFYFNFSCFSYFRLQVCLIICINVSNSHTVIQQLGERDPKMKVPVNLNMAQQNKKGKKCLR